MRSLEETHREDRTCGAIHASSFSPRAERKRLVLLDRVMEMRERGHRPADVVAETVDTFGC
jgi:hypothetical protein